jgi:hypothetical protein
MIDTTSALLKENFSGWMEALLTLHLGCQVFPALTLFLTRKDGISVHMSTVITVPILERGRLGHVKMEMKAMFAKLPRKIYMTQKPADDGPE